MLKYSIILISLSYLIAGEKITKSFHDNGIPKYIKYSNDRDTTILVKTIEIDRNGFITKFVKYSNGNISSKRIREYVHTNNSISIYDSSVVFQDTYFSKNKIIKKCIFKIDFTSSIDIEDISFYKDVTYWNKLEFINQRSGYHQSFNSLLSLNANLDKNINLSFSLNYINYSNRFSYPQSSYSNFGTITIGSLSKREDGSYKFVSFYNDIKPNSVSNNYKKFYGKTGELIEQGSYKTNIGSFNFSSSNKIDLWTYYSGRGNKEKEEFYIFNKEWERLNSSKLEWSVSYDANGFIIEKNNYKYNNAAQITSKIFYFDDGKSLKQSYDRITGGDTIFYKNGNYKEIKNTLANRIEHYKYYENGQLQSQNFWKEKHKDSLWISYYKNGKIRDKYKYLNDRIDGMKVKYYENGLLESEENYINGYRDGIWTKFYSNGQLNFKKKYQNNNPIESQLNYYDNGQLESERNYNINGNKHGEHIYYYRNGKIKTKNNYSKNKYLGNQVSLTINGDTLSYSYYNTKGLDGFYKEFYRNGNPKYIKFFSDGVQNGEYLYYRINGVLERKGTIKNNLEEGLWFRYFEDGNIEQKVTMNNGVPVIGTYTLYFPNGQISSIDTILSENKIQEKKYYSNGEIKSVINFELISVPEMIDCYDGDCKNTGQEIKSKFKMGLTKNFYENGKLKSIENYKIYPSYNSYSSYKEGMNVWFYENSDTAGISHYTKGKLDSTYTEYHKKGILKEKINYKSGKKNGTHSKYNESGNLIELYNYQDNKRHGLFIYDKQSKLTLIKEGGIYGNIYGTLDINPDSISYLLPKPNTDDWRFYDFKTGNYKNDKLDGKYISINRGYKEEGLYEYGQKEGEWITSNQNDVIIKKLFFLNDQRYGKQTSYYENGIIREEINYLEGYHNKNGPYTKYYNNGIIEEEGQYYRSNKTGLWIRNYKSGKLNKESFHNKQDMPDSVILYYENGEIKDRGYLANKRKSTYIQYDSKK